jgi:hypothetical protein
VEVADQIRKGERDLRIFSDTRNRNLIVRTLIGVSIVYFSAIFLLGSLSIGISAVTDFENFRSGILFVAFLAPQTILMLLLSIPLYLRRHVDWESFQLSLIWLFFFVIGTA